MPHPNDPNTPQNQDADPYIYANILNGMMQERNPLLAMWGDIGRMTSFMINLGKTRQMAKERLEIMNQQIAKVEHDMSTVNPPQVGTRLNKLR